MLSQRGQHLARPAASAVPPLTHGRQGTILEPSAQTPMSSSSQISPLFGAVLLRELSLTPQAIPMKLSGSRHPNVKNPLRCSLSPHGSSASHPLMLSRPSVVDSTIWRNINRAMIPNLTLGKYDAFDGCILDFLERMATAAPVQIEGGSAIRARAMHAKFIRAKFTRNVIGLARISRKE